MEPSVLVVLAVMALLATGAVFMAVRASRMRRYLHDTPTSSTAGVFIGDVEVKGIASSEAPLRTYLSETLCVHHSWSISEDWGRWVTETYRDDKGNTRTRRRWETGSTTIASGGEMIPFYVKDDTGFLLVRPDGARIEPRQTVRFSCGPDHAAYHPTRCIDGTSRRRRSRSMRACSSRAARASGATSWPPRSRQTLRRGSSSSPSVRRRMSQAATESHRGCGPSWGSWSRWWRDSSPQGGSRSAAASRIRF
jgi:hypothetical protein